MACHIHFTEKRQKALMAYGAENIIQTYSRSTTSALAWLVNEPVEGLWKLHEADLTGRDVGKLNRWELKFVRKRA